MKKEKGLLSMHFPLIEIESHYLAPGRPSPLTHTDASDDSDGKRPRDD